jgi:hypothetical protein
MRNVVGVCLLLAATAASAIAGPSATTPEPGTIALLGGGLVTFGVLAWRRNRRK